MPTLRSDRCCDEVGVLVAGVEAAMQWECVPQLLRAVGVFAGQQNLAEWLKGVIEVMSLVVRCCESLGASNRHTLLIQSVRLFVSEVECVSGASTVESGRSGAASIIVCNSLKKNKHVKNFGL